MSLELSALNVSRTLPLKLPYFLGMEGTRNAKRYHFPFQKEKITDIMSADAVQNDKWAAVLHLRSRNCEQSTYRLCYLCL
jgi:hypothetical protein